MFLIKDDQKPRLEQKIDRAGFMAVGAQRYNVVAVGRAYTDIIAHIS